MPRFRIPLLLITLAAVGCSETRSYDLTIRNEMPVPVTACLTKTSGPREADWESPEQRALPPNPASDETPPGDVIPPGQTAIRDGVNGKFDSKSQRAVLRIYQGTPGLSEMTAINRDSPRRVDVLLQPGVNEMTIHADKSGQMTVTRPSAWTTTTMPTR